MANKKFSREFRSIASTWQKSKVTRFEKEKENPSFEINPLFGRGNIIPPLFFPFSFSFLSSSFFPSPYETLDTKPSGTKVEARRIDRSIDRFHREEETEIARSTGRTLEWEEGASRESRFTRNERRVRVSAGTSRAELLDTVPSGTKHFSAARYNSKRFHDRYPAR